MLTLVIKELTEFQEAVKRDLIADGISRPVPPNDRQFMMALVTYGNEFLERAKNDRANRGAVIWFDINFGDPAVVGMTWAWNPRAPIDSSTGQPGFWRIWSETDPEVGSLRDCQEAFSSYCIQR
jgi:hypothetical protein